MIQTRRVQPQDLDYIFNHAASLGFRQDKMISMLDNMMLVLERGKICGIGFFVVKDNKCLINWVHIQEDYRRDKLGTMLVKTMLSTAEQHGALQAYIYGDCPDFADFLGFAPVLDKAQLKEIHNFYEECFKEKVQEPLFKVSLIDYFKSCCHK